MRKVGVGALVLLLILGVLALGVRLYMSRETESRLRTGEAVAFDALPEIMTRNVFVLCPASASRVGAAGASPQFDVPWEQLREYWQEMLAMQPRVDLVFQDRERRHLIYMQRSAVLRLPDIINVEFVGIDDGRSSLAIHSRSRYGYSDFGVNRARVLDWIALLKRMIRENRRPASAA